MPDFCTSEFSLTSLSACNQPNDPVVEPSCCITHRELKHNGSAGQDLPRKLRRLLGQLKAHDLRAVAVGASQLAQKRHLEPSSVFKGFAEIFETKSQQQNFASNVDWAAGARESVNRFRGFD